jgi:hypothetical protein
LKKIFLKLMGWMVYLAVLAAFTEGASYLLFRKPFGIFPRYVTGAQYGEFSIRRNVPNAVYEHKSFDGTWHYQINSQGFRDVRDFPYEKNKGVVRVLLLGDSFTIGYEARQDETFGAVLERRLREKGHDVEVINAGVSGFSTAEELVFLEQEGLRYQPDVIVLGFFTNDLVDNLRADLYRVQDGKLKIHKKEYLPAIKTRDYLNSFSLYRWLGQHSYFWNFLNVAATLVVKKAVEAVNKQDVVEKTGIPAGDMDPYAVELTGKLLARIYEIARRNQSRLILIDIPDPYGKRSLPSGIQPGEVSDFFVDGLNLLNSLNAKGPLYRPHGQKHWTEISHEAVGNHLADWIEKEILLKKAGN